MKKKRLTTLGKKKINIQKLLATPVKKAIPGFTRFTAMLDAIAASIVQEILDEMNKTLTIMGKSFAANALNEWQPKLEESVRNRLLKGGNWQTDRLAVLQTARDMATISAILSFTSPQIAKGRVHAAFRAVKDHAACPGNLGSGRWCSFDM